eukprot:3777082-Prymnesium_polylepis.2
MKDRIACANRHTAVRPRRARDAMGWPPDACQGAVPGPLRQRWAAQTLTPYTSSDVETFCRSAPLTCVVS